MALSVVISRSNLSKAPLSIGPGHSGALSVAGDGLRKPDQRWRRGYAPESSDMHGAVLLTAVLEQASIPLEVLVRGNDRATLVAARDELAEALGQFHYETTLTVDGESATYSSDPADIAWAGSKGYLRRHFLVAVITIPVYPIGA